MKVIKKAIVTHPVNETLAEFEQSESEPYDQDFDEHNEESDYNDYSSDYSSDYSDIYPTASPAARATDECDGHHKHKHKHKHNEELDDDAINYTDIYQLDENERGPENDNIEIVGKDISASKPSRFSNLEEYANSHPLAITKPENSTDTSTTDNIKYKDFYIDFEKKIIDIIFNIVLPPICYLYPSEENLEEAEPDGCPSTISLLKPKFRAYENGKVIALSYVKINNIKTFVKLKHGYKFRYNDMTLYIYNTSLLGLLFPSTHSLSFDLITKMKINRGFSDYVRNGIVSSQNKLNGRSKNIMNAIKRIAKNFTEEERDGFISELFED